MVRIRTNKISKYSYTSRTDCNAIIREEIVTSNETGCFRFDAVNAMPNANESACACYTSAPVSGLAYNLAACDNVNYANFDLRLNPKGSMLLSP